MTTAIVPVVPASLLPALTIEQAVARRQQMIQYVQAQMGDLISRRRKQAPDDAATNG